MDIPEKYQDILSWWEKGREAFLAGLDAQMMLESTEGCVRFIERSDDDDEDGEPQWYADYYRFEYEVSAESPGKLFAVVRNCDCDGNWGFVTAAEYGSEEDLENQRQYSNDAAQEEEIAYARYVQETGRDPIREYGGGEAFPPFRQVDVSFKARRRKGRITFQYRVDGEPGPFLPVDDTAPQWARDYCVEDCSWEDIQRMQACTPSRGGNVLTWTDRPALPRPPQPDDETRRRATRYLAECQQDHKRKTFRRPA